MKNFLWFSWSSIMTLFIIIVIAHFILPSRYLWLENDQLSTLKGFAAGYLAVLAFDRFVKWASDS